MWLCDIVSRSCFSAVNIILLAILKECPPVGQCCHVEYFVQSFVGAVKMFGAPANGTSFWAKIKFSDLLWWTFRCWALWELHEIALQLLHNPQMLSETLSFGDKAELTELCLFSFILFWAIKPPTFTRIIKNFFQWKNLKVFVRTYSVLTWPS